MIDNTVVKELDVQKYLGTWYEIARYDHSFERGLVGVTANYSMRDDGKIRVINSDYYIMELDKDYQWAVIGSSSEKYLWILSRSQQMSPGLYAELLERLTKRGYDISKLISVEQKN